MRIDPKECGLLVSDANSNQHDKDSVIQLAFEEFQVPAFFTIKKSILSLFANGKTSGLVLESGATVTQVVPISEGYTLYKSMITSHIGGETVTQQLIDFVEQSRGKELLPHFYYKYSSEPDGQTTTTLKDIGHVDPSVLEFHKRRIGQEMKEVICKVANPSDEKYDKNNKANSNQFNMTFQTEPK